MSVNTSSQPSELEAQACEAAKACDLEAHEERHCSDGSCADEHAGMHRHHHQAATAHQLQEEPTFIFKVLDMDCPSCAKAVENAVRVTPGVKDASVNYATATLAVVADPAALPVDVERAVLSCVRSCGEDLELTQAQADRLDAERSWFETHRELALMAVSGVGILGGLVAEYGFAAPLAALGCYLAAALAGLAFVGPMAVASLRRHTADMNLLMGVAVAGALVMGFVQWAYGNLDLDVFRDGAVVIFLDQIGEWLEGWSMRKTRGSVESLAQLAPDIAHVVRPDGTTKDVELDQVEEGEVVRVLPGERVPLDGTVIAGASSFDEAPVTGESVPQDKGEGAEVFGGTLNTIAAVDVRVTSDADCGTLARIISQVQGAQAEKAPYEAFVDRFAAVYTPAVVAIACAVGLGVPVCLSVVAALLGMPMPDWSAWIWRALTLLVIACPCALVISTPVSFVSAISRAAHLGVLVKGGAYFDIGSKVDAIAFDKTGTLTQGEPALVSVAVLSERVSRQRLLALAAALEANSTHPLAQAVVKAAKDEGAPTLVAAQVAEKAGNGMTGQVEGLELSVGKPAFAAEQGALSDEAQAAVKAAAAQGATALVVRSPQELLGVIGLADSVRSTTPAALQALAHDGIRTQVMLTGDSTQVAQVVAKSLGEVQVAAELLPADKVQAIKGLQAQDHVVAMVGDGINDAPALASANLGITMGAAASDTALEVADVALMAGDLSQLPAFFRLSRRTMAVVRENIFFAIAVKATVLVLAVMGLAGMGAAIFADTGVALLVVLNGMRLMCAWDTRF